MKKNVVLLLALMTISTANWAVSTEYFGYLKSGDGLCSVAIEEQSWAYHYVDFKTRDYTVKAANVTLQKGQLASHNEVFDKEGDEYQQLAFGFPLPRTYQIQLKNLGKGQFAIKRTTLVFSQPTITRKDVCITK
jgi:hypothetical protein